MSRTPFVFVLSLVALLLLAAPAALRAEEDVHVRIEETMPLEEFLRAFQKMGMPLSWDPKSRAIVGKEVVGPLELRGPRGAIFDRLRALLTFYDLVLIPVGGEGGVLLVVDARQTSAILKLKPDFVEIDASNVATYDAQDGRFVSALLRLGAGRNATTVRNALARVVTGQNIGSVTEVSADTLLVTDFAPNVAHMWRIARTLSVTPEAASSPDVVFRAVRLKEAEALQVAAILASHFGTRRGPQPVAAGPQPPAPEPAQPLRIDADPRTNQVLVTGPAHLVEAVQGVIASLDVPLPQPETAIQVVRLAHVRAAHAAMALGNLIQRAGGGFGEGPRPVVQSHDETNSLLLFGTPDALASLRRVVAELDVDTGEPSDR